MQRNNNITSQLDRLTPSQIHQMSAQEMRSLLLSLQHPAQPSSIQHQQQSSKTKQIYKFKNKQELKDLIKSKLERRRANGNWSRKEEKYTQSREGGWKSHQEQEGKLNFKQSALLQTDIKNNSTFLPKPEKINKMPTYLSRTSLDQLCCPICLETLISPSLTNCGHTFCAQCIDQSLLVAHTCPTCRENIRGLQLVVCSLLDKLIRFKYELSHQEKEEEYNHYMQRLERNQSWAKSRYIDYSTIKVGDIVDVRDTETIWCQATITQIYTKYDKRRQTKVNTSILVHYNRWHNIYNQIIEIPSSRFAPRNYFSSRSDIIHYNLAQSEGNVRGSVANGLSAIDNAPNLIQYIRIEESQHSDSFISSNSDIEENSVDQNLSNLAPGQEESQVESVSSDRSSLDLMDYVNRVRNNVLHRLAPHQRRQFEDAINLEDQYNYGEDEDDYQYVPSASQPLSPPQDHQQSLIESNNYSLMPSESPYQLDLMNSIEYPGEMAILKDNSDEEQEIFGPQQPSNLFEQHYG